MARQVGAVKYLGTIGDLTYKRTRHGYLVQEKSPLDAERIATDPKFKRTRENNRDFATALKGAKLVLDAVKTIITRPGDANVFPRLMSRARAVVKSDPVNPRGAKTVADGTISLFEEFEFNKVGPLSTVIKVTPGATIDRVTGELEVTVPSFVPDDKFSVPEGTTHYKLIAVGSEIDFANGSFQSVGAQSGYLPVDTTTATTPVTLTCALPPASMAPLFLGLGVQFYVLDPNTQYYPLSNGRDTPFQWLKVDA